MSEVTPTATAATTVAAPTTAPAVRRRRAVRIRACTSTSRSSGPVGDAPGSLREAAELFDVHDRLLSSTTGASAASTRSLASAFEHWLFTVPTVQPEQVGGLGLGAVLEVAEDHDRALPGREATDRQPQVLVVAPGRRGPHFSGRFVGGVSRVPPAAPPRGGRRDHDPAHVRLGVLDPAPREPRLGQRRLEQVLRSPLVLDEKVGRAQQGLRPREHERVEVPPLRHAITTFLLRPSWGATPETRWVTGKVARVQSRGPPCMSPARPPGRVAASSLVELAVDEHEHHPGDRVAAVGPGVVGAALDDDVAGAAGSPRSRRGSA